MNTEPISRRNSFEWRLQAVKVVDAWTQLTAQELVGVFL